MTLSRLLAELERDAERGSRAHLSRLVGSFNRADHAELSEELAPIRHAMEQVFDCSTSFGDCSVERPSTGHCFLASMFLQDSFGGEILFGEVKQIPHYWNRIDGLEIDLTGDQFRQPAVQVRRGKLRPAKFIFQRKPQQRLTSEDNRQVMKLYDTFKCRVARQLKKDGRTDLAQAFE